MATLKEAIQSSRNPPSPRKLFKKLESLRIFDIATRGHKESQKAVQREHINLFMQLRNLRSDAIPVFPRVKNESTADFVDRAHNWLVKNFRLNRAEQQPPENETNIEWSRIMNKQGIATALGLDSVYKLNMLKDEGIYEIRKVGKKRQSWQIRIDKLDKYLQQKLRL